MTISKHQTSFYWFFLTILRFFLLFLNFVFFYYLWFISESNPLGDENSLVARSTIETRLADIPNCWICVDVGQTRALSPTHFSVMHGSSDKVPPFTYYFSFFNFYFSFFTFLNFLLLVYVFILISIFTSTLILFLILILIFVSFLILILIWFYFKLKIWF